MGVLDLETTGRAVGTPQFCRRIDAGIALHIWTAAWRAPVFLVPLRACTKFETYKDIACGELLGSARFIYYNNPRGRARPLPRACLSEQPQRHHRARGGFARVHLRRALAATPVF